jgi:DNA polymerase-3 subunit epsilon
VPVSLQLAEASFTVLDLESTGGKPPEHRITEIAAYRIERLQIVGQYHTLVNPGRSIPHFVSNLTGITDEMLSSAPRSGEVLRELMGFIGDSALVAHHSEFDRGFLNHELKLARLPGLANEDVCTCRLARRILPWLPSKSLGDLAAFFGLKIEGRHRASGDALAASKLLLCFLDYLSYRGVGTVQQLISFQREEIGYPR